MTYICLDSVTACGMIIVYQCHFEHVEIFKAGDQVVEQKVISKEDNTATRYLDPQQAINMNQEQQWSQNRPLRYT